MLVGRHLEPTCWLNTGQLPLLALVSVIMSAIPARFVHTPLILTSLVYTSSGLVQFGVGYKG